MSNIISFYQSFTPYYEYILDPFLKAYFDGEDEMKPQTAVKGAAAMLGQALFTAQYPLTSSPAY